jgi:endoglycosylceramidase
MAVFFAGIISILSPVRGDVVDEGDPGALALRVDGDRLIDGAGREVILRGFCAGQRTKLPPFYPFDPVPDFDTALEKFADTTRSLGFNVIRLLIIWEAVEPERGIYDENYLANYEKIVNAFARRGVRVIVDSHQDVASRKFCGDGLPGWALAERYRDKPERINCRLWEINYLTPKVLTSLDRLWADKDGIQERYVAMFEMLAKRFKDQPAVIGFEPINEPPPGYWGIIHYYSWYQKQLFPFYERVARAVHSVDNRYLIFADICSIENQTGIWNLKLKKPDVANLVFAPHYYDMGTFGVSWSPGGDQDTMRKGLTRHKQLALNWGVPILFTEYGVSMLRDDAAQYINRFYEVLDELHLSGTVWEASMSPTLWNRRQKNFLDPEDGSIRPPAFALDRPYPRAVAGEIKGFLFDADTRTFKLSWQESLAISSPTIIYAPSHVYPDGPRVALDAGEYKYDKAGQILLISPLGKSLSRDIVISP